MGDVHYIVEKLSAPPFNYQLDLVRFAEKSSNDLLQIISDVFSAISTKHAKVDVAKDGVDHAVDRITNFLRIVKYKPTVDGATFRQLLGAGDKGVMYHVLKWVLPQAGVLEKRAVVGYFMSLPDMPEELNYDADVMELKEEIKQLQAEFVEAHKNSEAAKAATRDAANLKQKIRMLEEEREKLGDKVERARNQVNSLADKANYLDVCVSLRKQQDEEIHLSQQIVAQRAQLERAQAAHAKASASLRELEASSLDSSGARLLEALEDTVQNLRYMVGEKYPRDIESKQKRLAAVQEVLHNGINTSSDLERLADQERAASAALQQQMNAKMAADKARQTDKAYLQVRQAAQMANQVTKRREEVFAKLERLQEKRAALDAQFERQAAREAGGGGGDGGAVVSEEAWRSKYESIKAALPVYKRLKKELALPEAELQVLDRTLELLTAQDRNAAANVAAQERQQGVEGFADVAATLEKISETKSQLDEVKGARLAEISRTVDEINREIKGRKSVLAPRVVELRTKRQEYQDLEAEVAAAKASHDEALGTLSSRLSALESEVGTLKTEVMEDDAKVALLTAQMQALEVELRRVSTASSAETFKERLERKIADGERAAKELREQQRGLKDANAGGLSQIDLMQDMIKLLQLKIDYHKQAAGGYGGGHQMFMQQQPQQHHMGGGGGGAVQWPGLNLGGGGGGGGGAGGTNVFVL